MLQLVSCLRCQRCRCCLPCLPKLRGPVQGLVILGVVVLGDDKHVFFVIILLLLLVVGVVGEGCQRPPHNLGTREALKHGPCFAVGHAPLDSEGKLGCCHNAIVRAHPRAAVSVSHADFAPDGSGRRGSEQRLLPQRHRQGASLRRHLCISRQLCPRRQRLPRLRATLVLWCPHLQSCRRPSRPC